MQKPIKGSKPKPTPTLVNEKVDSRTKKQLICSLYFESTSARLARHMTVKLPGNPNGLTSGPSSSTDKIWRTSWGSGSPANDETISEDYFIEMKALMFRLGTNSQYSLLNCEVSPPIIIQSAFYDKMTSNSHILK